MKNRFALYTPYNMIRFHAGLVVILTRDLSNATAMLTVPVSDGYGLDHLKTLSPVRESVLHALGELLSDPQEMPLPQAMRWRIERLKTRIETEDHMTLKEAEVLLKELHNDIAAELANPYFLMVPANRRHLYEQREPLFGKEVEQAFPGASRDIAAAGRCIALDEWTAAVFRLSRVAEISMVAIGRKVGYDSPKPGFGEALRYMDGKLEQARNDYKRADPNFKGRIEFLSAVTVHMHAVNTAWRQQVAHLDNHYCEKEALRIWEATKGFMQQLAEGES